MERSRALCTTGTLTRVIRVRDVLAAVRCAYPESLAESWDTGIGLTCGDPADPVELVLLAVDADRMTVDEAVDRGAQVLLTHHPLLFRPVQSVAADSAKGALVHRLVRAGVAHIAAHTNADRAIGGVNDALADALGLRDAVPLRAGAEPSTDKIVVFVPPEHEAAVIAAMAAAGAGVMGEYTQAAFSSPGTGQFRPGPGAHPFIGDVGRVERVAETRVEMIARRARRAGVLAAVRAAHPYEEPAIDVLELAAQPARTGLGRVGALAEPLTLAEFADVVAARLPRTVGGVRAAGDPDRTVQRVAVCGGAGDGELGAAADAGADVYVTSDLRHHAVAEFVAVDGNPAVVEVAHWAGEWPWLAHAAGVLDAEFGAAVRTAVSTLRTDPWTLRAAGDADAFR